MNVLREKYQYLKNRKKVKVFGIGFNKTGTTSLTLALKELGCDVAPEYFFEPLLVNVLDGDFQLLIKRCFLYNAFQDIPFSLPLVYKEIYKQFPKAKFILDLLFGFEKEFFCE